MAEKNMGVAIDWHCMVIKCLIISLILSAVFLQANLCLLFCASISGCDAPHFQNSDLSVSITHVVYMSQNKLILLLLLPRYILFMLFLPV